MNDNINPAAPLVMHIDLNSAFATTEQQARPMLRGKPVAIVNRRSPNAAVITAIYEAKAKGVKVGTRMMEAKLLCPGIIAVESDPLKYRFVFKKLIGILSDYSPKATMKSIDEGLIDFNGMAINRPMIDVGMEIKQRLKNEIGNHMRCNVGIGTNRFLAKTAAGLHKPDGLDEINSKNLRTVFSGMKLRDITGIADGYGSRLEAVGINTPLEFLDADIYTLEKIVFKGIVGRQWHMRLKGWEVDDREFKMGRVGRQYVLESANLKYDQIITRLHSLCESVGYRLRSQNKSARGIYVYVRTQRGYYWHKSKLMTLPFFSNKAIYNLSRQLFFYAPGEIREIGVHCYHLEDYDQSQISLFGDEIAREKNLNLAVDTLNDRYGEQTIHSAHTLESGDFVKTKIPFGGVRYF